MADANAVLNIDEGAFGDAGVEIPLLVGGAGGGWLLTIWLLSLDLNQRAAYVPVPWLSYNKGKNLLTYLLTYLLIIKVYLGMSYLLR